MSYYDIRLKPESTMNMVTTTTCKIKVGFFYSTTYIDLIHTIIL